MKNEQEHIVKICLSPELRSGLIKYMSKHDLDKHYAVLSLLLKSMRSEGLISQEDFEFYTQKYSKTVSSMSQRVKHKSKMTLEQQREKQTLEEKARLFGFLLPSQWELHPKPEWRQKWIVEAEKWQGKVPEAKTFLERYRKTGSAQQ